MKGRAVQEDRVLETAEEEERVCPLVLVRQDFLDPFAAFALHLSSKRTTVTFYFKVPLARPFYKSLS